MKYCLACVAAVVLSATAIAALWSWLGRPVDLVAVPFGRIDCLSYVPTHRGAHPLRGPDYTVPAQLIEKDLAALRALTGCIRTYSSYGVQGEVLPVAAAMGLEVLLGIWIGADEARNRQEIDAALAAAARHPQAIRAIVVGNEVLLRREMTAQRLAGIINLIEAIDQPWKRLAEGTVGGYWGILDSDREPKFALTGAVREWPDARAGAIFSMGTSAAFLALALLCGRRPRWLRALGISLTGAATGTCLWMLSRQVPTLAIGVTGQAWGAYLLIVATAGGVLAGAQLAGLPAAYRRQPACLARVLDGIRERALSPAQRLGMWQWTILLPAAIVALALAVDGRHRDFLTLAFVLPAIALAMQARYAASREPPHPPELAWITLLLVVAGPLAVDAPGNLEAIAWAATCWLLALPGLPAVATEFAQLRRILSAEREAEQG